MKNVDLKVPYEQKDAAKALGAWWSHERKCWFVPSGVLLAPFAEWLPAGDWLKAKDSATLRKSARRGKAPPGRPDDTVGKVIIGVNYVPVLDPVGLPWN